MSANAFIRDELEAICDDFLIKPLDVEKLLHVLRILLRLEWIYAEPANVVASHTQLEAEETLIPPPEEDLLVLFDLAQKGALTDLKRQAIQIEQMNERFGPFTQKLCQLVNEFEEDQIMKLIERYVMK